MNSEREKRECGYEAGTLGPGGRVCGDCRRAIRGGDDWYCARHHGMLVHAFGVCRDWMAARKGVAV